MTTSSTGRLRLAVPAYAHPLVDPSLWARLVDAADVLRLVVVNPHDGPGAVADPAYPPVLEPLQAAGVRLAGYVDTDYGRRPAADVVADVVTYARRYGLQAVFLDQVSTGLDQLDHYAQLVAQVRAAGARFVVLNPGTHPHPGYVDLANLTVTFEGTWEDYRELQVPAWTGRYAASRLCHLVHAVPADRLGPALALAAGRHVEAVHVTGGSGANPWDDAPAEVVSALQGAGTAAPQRHAPDRPTPQRPAVPPVERRSSATRPSPAAGTQHRAAPVPPRPAAQEAPGPRPPGPLLAAALALAGALALVTAAASALPAGRPLLLGLLALLLGAGAGALVVARATPLTARDLNAAGSAYALTGLAGLALAGGLPLSLAGLALSGAGAAVLAPAVLRLALAPAAAPGQSP